LWDARLTLVGFAIVVLAGWTAGWGKEQLPQRPPAAQPAPNQTAPDLALYAAIIADVRSGRDYYDAAHERIPQFGFPTASPLNWRLPTYAWLLSWLPNKCWIQAVLLLLGVMGLGLVFHAERLGSSIGQAAFTTLLMFGVLRWVLDGEAYLAQEVWAGVLVMISLASYAISERSSARAWWRGAAIASATLALLFRELALPYLLVAGGLALWRRRWIEAAFWCIGVMAFVDLLVWHVFNVQNQVGAHAGGAGLSQWLRFGGLDFVLLTTRMNSLLFFAPPALLWLYIVLSMFGLARRVEDASRLACVAALAYLAAFALVGRPENFYWGLMAAPLLAWGAGNSPAAIANAWRQAAPRQPAVSAGHGSMRGP
jgi:hypothetical protein